MLPKKCLVDTGFWIAFFDNRDSHHEEAQVLAELIFEQSLLCPFPTLYEFLNTRFCRDVNRLAELERVFNKLNLVYIFDDDYRAQLLEGFIRVNRTNQSMSAVDFVINSIIEDVNYKIDYVVTFNPRDFRHTCLKRGIEILPEN